METRKIGSLNVSIVGLGTNNFGARIDETQSARVIETAIDAGVNFIDTADIYGATQSEQFIGRALKGRRDDVVLATKIGNKIDDDHLGGGRPGYVRAAAEDCLRRLQTDRIDLLLLHRPDPTTPIAETLGTLDELVKEGKVVQIGCSDFSLEQLEEAEDAPSQGAARLVNLQSEYSLLERGVERDVLPECDRAGIAFVPYFPLASGLLSGKYRSDAPPPQGSRLAAWPEERRGRFLNDGNFAAVDRLTKFCADRGHSLLDLALSFVLARPAVASVIPGATSPEQVLANVAGGQWKLSEDELEAIDELVPLQSGSPESPGDRRVARRPVRRARANTADESTRSG